MSIEDKDLALIYRPTTWEDIKGQGKVVNSLRNQVLTKKGLSNAYLFYGPSGVGKTTVAKLFFKALNCISITPDGNPCEKCISCKEPYGSLFEINAADKRGIDDVRNVSGWLRCMLPLGGGVYRGAFLDECQMLTTEAWNCLLKPLEQPFNQAFWLLATTDIQNIPAGVLTRCQKFYLGGISNEKIVNRLKEIAQKEKLEISEKDLLAIAKSSNNNLREGVLNLGRYLSDGSTDNIETEIFSQVNRNDHKKISKNNKEIILTGIQPQIINVLKGMSSQVRNEKLQLKEIKENLPDIKDNKTIARELRAMGLEVKLSAGISHLIWDTSRLTKLFKHL